MILDELVAAARERVAYARVETPLDEMRARVLACPAPLDFAAALRAPAVSLIAEVKRASPSRGALDANLDPAALARGYAAGGAAAISVLTEPTRFGGSLADLGAVRASLAQVGQARPLLRKDFIVDAYQLYEARAAGADAVLLITAALDDATLAALYDAACDLGLAPLVEVHDAAEMARAAALHPIVVGINNRDLRTMTVDLATTARLRPCVPTGCLVVAESGIHSPEDVRRLASLGVDAMLVGEALVTAPDPLVLARALVEAGR
jgi:indole-3-glycerol phosphate synthase